MKEYRYKTKEEVKNSSDFIKLQDKFNKTGNIKDLEAIYLFIFDAARDCEECINEVTEFAEEEFKKYVNVKKAREEIIKNEWYGKSNQWTY